MRNCTEFLVHLIESGAEVDSCDQSKQTSLFFTVEHDVLDVVRILLEYGAKVNIMNDMYFTSLIWLIWTENGESKSFAITKIYLRKKEATIRDAKRAWILNKLELL